jgi:ribose 5-phosphate isomerase A
MEANLAVEGPPAMRCWAAMAVSGAYEFSPERAAAAEAAAGLLEPGMTIGLGSGRAVWSVVEAIVARFGPRPQLRVAVASDATYAIVHAAGVEVVPLDGSFELDVAIDGADEIDPGLDLIKGLGGAHLREKVVASAGRAMIVVADESKLVARLGERAPLPVEVVGFALPVCERALCDLGWEATRRRAADGTPFVTDEGNAIVDCRRGDWTVPVALAAAVKAVPGVVEHGFFLGMATAAVVGTADGVRVLERGSRPAAVP